MGVLELKKTLAKEKILINKSNKGLSALNPLRIPYINFLNIIPAFRSEKYKISVEKKKSQLF